MFKKTLVLWLLPLFSGLALAEGDFKTKVVKSPSGDYTLSWRINGADLDVKAKVKSKGWIGVGFGSKASMEGAKLIIGKVDKAGKVLIAPFFGVTATQPEPVKKLGGKIDISNDTGKRDGDFIEISFTTPLGAADKFGYDINPEKVFVLLSYADSDSFKEKHAFRTAFPLNLATGK